MQSVAKEKESGKTMPDETDVSRTRFLLNGPICSLRPPFNRDGALDDSGLRRYIERAIAGGCRSLILTAGDSLATLLSDRELQDLTGRVIEYVNGRVGLVACDRVWSTPQVARFAGNVKSMGADMLMVLPPDWGHSTTVADLCRHYAAAAEQIPVMVVTNFLTHREPEFRRDLIRRLLKDVRGVVAIKDDAGGEFGRWLTATCSHRWAVFPGGRKARHLELWPYGCSGYLSTLATFLPEVTRQYWQSIQAEDLGTAAALVRDIDDPFFEIIKATPGGFDAAIHAIMEMTGIAGRWRRSPYHSLDDSEFTVLRERLRTVPAWEAIL